MIDLSGTEEKAGDCRSSIDKKISVVIIRCAIDKYENTFRIIPIIYAKPPA